MTKVLAPAKLILSGEHAVLYGQPAIATAINQFTVCNIADSMSAGVRLTIPAFSYSEHKTWKALFNLENILKQRYQQFTNNIIPIEKVLSFPHELCWFAITHLISQEATIKHTGGLEVSINTDVPLSRGLGSSAAIIMAIMTAINAHLQLKKNHSTIFQAALSAENLQHGHSSGIDIKIVQQGGTIIYQQQKVAPTQLTEFPFQLVDTGKAQSSTGECCQKVKKYFADSSIWKDFSNCTNELLDALKKNDLHQIKLAIQTNHQLLCKISVIPDKVKSFISKIESLGGAAKICGAGSIRGDAAGVVLVSKDIDLSNLCEEFNYPTPKTITGNAHGTKII